jgi:hypothetical protein
MSGLSSGTDSCGGDGARFLRGGGEGDRCFLSKNDRMVPFFFFFFFFFWGDAFVAFAGEAWMGISSSVAGGVERSESEDMVVGCGGGRGEVRQEVATNDVDRTSK